MNWISFNVSSVENVKWYYVGSCNGDDEVTFLDDLSEDGYYGGDKNIVGLDDVESEYA